MRKNNAIIVLLISALTCGILIFSFENEFYFLQITVGFLIYILPSIFITSLQSKLTLFILSSTTILLVYFSFKYQFYGVWIGVLEALVIGRAINIFKIQNKINN